MRNWRHSSMGIMFEDDALEQLLYWMKQDRKLARTIHDIIKDIRRNGLSK
ncbi:MAG: type II toxin-antitoxin system YoeB family toxin, partial [Selenomonadaceae bacterium]|nr:type II toxin-antitoxin system YoeB family toxin [Selenomonadaceae bacterium]